ncbi:hypothetical protein BDF22DRAFT_98413 [Syncephalis plumigaleata]|nr:hypothetical protein BDF22DRAFT_98413 [Syncephalis plumigaleata]
MLSPLLIMMLMMLTMMLMDEPADWLLADWLTGWLTDNYVGNKNDKSLKTLPLSVHLVGSIKIILLVYTLRGKLALIIVFYYSFDYYFFCFLLWLSLLLSSLLPSLLSLLLFSYKLTIS